VDIQNEQGDMAKDTENFISQLREQHPVIKPGSTLHLEGPFPLGVRYIRDVYLPSLVGLYYEDVEVVEGDVPRVLPEGDVVFAYEPDG